MVREAGITSQCHRHCTLSIWSRSSQSVAAEGQQADNRERQVIDMPNALCRVTDKQAVLFHVDLGLGGDNVASDGGPAVARLERAAAGWQGRSTPRGWVLCVEESSDSPSHLPPYIRPLVPRLFLF
jgi:hypothetical protein